MVKYILLLGLFLCGNAAFGMAVPESDARAVAERFASTHPLFARTGVSYQIKAVAAWQSFWVVTLSPCGYIVLSADDDDPPIRSFATEGTFLFSADHPVTHRLTAVAKSRPVAPSNMRPSSSPVSTTASAGKWAALRNPKPAALQVEPAGQTVGPLLTSTWGQGLYYNAMCPIRSDGKTDNGGHMVNGCVALAGAQLLRYHAWPPRGISTKEHYAQKSDLTRPMLWSEMLDAYPEFGTPRAWENIRAVAWLCMDVGSLVDMNYGNDGSSSDLFSLQTFLPEYFHYMEDAEALQSHTYTPAELADACVEDLDKGNPVLTRSVIYSDETKTDGTGHAWLVDGYYRDDDLGLLIHANYGWDGQNNDWYSPDAMKSNSELLGAITGLVPHPFPLFRPMDGVYGPSFTLTWDVPKKYDGTYEAFRIIEGSIADASTADFSKVDLWTIGENYQWTALEGGGWDMNCGMPGQPGLRDPIIAHTGAQLIITHKLPDFVTVTPYVYNGVDIWAGDFSEFDSLPASDGFMTSRIDIPDDRLGRPMRIDLGVVNNASWSTPLSGIIQKIEVTNCEEMRWTPVSDTIPGTARSFTMTSVSEGRHFYRIESKRDGGWDARIFAETEMLPVIVANAAVPAPTLSVNEMQIVSPWTPPLMLHVDVDNPSGRPLTFAVEDTGYSVVDETSSDPALLPPADFAFTNIMGETFLVLPDKQKITAENHSTWVKISATTPEGAKGTTWFVLGAFKSQQTVSTFADKTAAFAAACTTTPAKKVLLVALNESYAEISFNRAVNAGLNDALNRAILAKDYVVWRVNVSDTNTWSDVAPFASDGFVYSGGQFVCIVDPEANTRVGDKVIGFYTTTFRELIDPDGTCAAMVAFTGMEQPRLRPITIDRTNGMSLLVELTSPLAQYSVLSTDTLTAGFTTTNTFRFAGETQDRQHFTGPRGAALLQVPIHPTESARFYKVMATPAGSREETTP